MSSLNQLISGDENAWIDALPPYQANHLHALIKKGYSPEQAASAWLTIQGPANTLPFGGDSKQPFRSLFYDMLAREVEGFICGAEKYGVDRAKLLSELKPTHAYVIAAISAAVSPVVGAAAPLIAPAVALILFTTARLGVNAWCAARKEIKNTDVPLIGQK